MKLSKLLAALVVSVPLVAQAEARIVVPSPGGTVHSNSNEVVVVVAGAPPGTRYRAVLDGAVVGQPQGSPGFSIANVERGVHRVAVELLDARGNVIGRTDEVEFNLWHASRLMPARRK
jgi:hypothetical protein